MHKYALCIYARTKRADLASQVQKLLDSRGWNQSQLAAELGISQGHLSKVVRGLAPGSRKIIDRLDGVINRTSHRKPEPWVSIAQEAGAKSSDARIAIEAIARIVKRSRL
ncbi:helix-turn-helix domain-containing protein [Bradyrhizobium sp. USDA 4529]